jgi:cobalt transporter subunit CbtA
MIGRVLLAAILAGLAAGFLMGVIQHVRLTPIILKAEGFEHVAHGHSTEAHSHDGIEWKPEEGFERTAYTTVMTMVTGAGFALVLAAVSMLTNIKILPSNGWLWGLGGFAAFSFAPALGVPPQLPGMADAALQSRQWWWMATVFFTGMGLLTIARASTLQRVIPGVIAIALPHVVRPFAPVISESHLPPDLAAQFVAQSLGANLVFWLAIGAGLAYALEYFKVSEVND